MSKKIKVHSTFKDSCLFIVPLLFVATFIWADYDMYVVEGKPLGFAFVLSIIFTAASLALSVLFYALFSSRMTIDGDRIVIRKWNFATRKIHFILTDEIFILTLNLVGRGAQMRNEIDCFIFFIPTLNFIGRGAQMRGHNPKRTGGNSLALAFPLSPLGFSLALPFPDS